MPLKQTFWYVPLESLKARYTNQLCTKWIPEAFDRMSDVTEISYRWQEATPPYVSQEIKLGSVLDGVNRGIVSLSQMTWLLEQVSQMTSEDVIYLQDFWTPGLEALAYALHLQGIKPRIYAMCHAQSVDEYDFTYSMRSWMRPIEVAYSRLLSGLFVASTVHRDQLKAAGFECPIHVVGLPIDINEVTKRLPVPFTKRKQVIFSSRLNNEKNPHFMLDVAESFLQLHSDWEWVVTTGGQRFVSEVPGVLKRMTDLMITEPRFKMKIVSKEEYYEQLAWSAIQFNSSLQDYVSWTLLEATIAECDICYPNFRSFPECCDPARLYQPFDRISALSVLSRCIRDQPRFSRKPAVLSDRGRMISMAIMLQGYDGPEVNVWHQPESYFKAAGLLP